MTAGPTLDDQAADTQSIGGQVTVDQAMGGQTPPGRSAKFSNLLGWTWRGSLVVLAGQLVVLFYYSAKQYSRFDLSIDYSTFNQAAWLIDHGHFDPWSTINGYPFLDDHFALILWLLAPVCGLFPHIDVLQFIQDIAAATAEAVALRWVLEIVEASSVKAHGDWFEFGGPAVVVGALVAMVANPWLYVGMFFDFHTEVLATLFLTLVLRSAWHQRKWWAAGWCVPLLLCGDTGGLFLAAVGVSLLVAMRKQWWFGLATVAVGLAWMRLAEILGVSHNNFLDGYSYLQTGNPAVTTNVTAVSLLGTLLRHPHRWLRVVWERRVVLYQNLIPTGVVGVFSPWSFGTAAVVFLSSVLMMALIFVESGFQNLPAYLVTLGGSVLVICGLASSPRQWIRAAATVLGIAIVIQSCIYGVDKVPGVRGQWISTTPAQAAVLQQALNEAPTNVEVVADWGVIGRFSSRPWIYSLFVIPQGVPVNSSTVMFIVVPDQADGNEPLSATEAGEAIQFLRDKLHVRTLIARDGIFVYEWKPPKGTTTLAIT